MEQEGQLQRDLPELEFLVELVDSYKIYKFMIEEAEIEVIGRILNWMRKTPYGALDIVKEGRQIDFKFNKTLRVYLKKK